MFNKSKIMSNKNKTLSIVFGMALLSLSACKKDSKPTVVTPEPGTEKTYSFVVNAGTPSTRYIVQTSSLTEGTLTTTGNGVESNLGVIASKNGYYYAFDYSSNNLVKFTSNNKKNTIIKEIPLSQISWADYSSFFAWKDDKTLVLFSSDASLQFEYAVLNVETMTITASGNINIPAAVDPDYYWGNNAAFVGNKLYISYSKIIGATELPDGKTYLASMDFPNVSNVTITTDSRSYYPSPYTLYTPGTFVYNGSAYFLNSNTVWSGSDTNSPTGILRVNNSGTSFDNSYFYEFIDKTKEEAIGMFSLNNGKAIVKILDKSLIKAYTDYSSANAASYYVVDVENKTKTKINIPLSRSGAYGLNILVEDGKAYIVSNAGDGYYVYVYDIATTTVTKGLKLDGVTGVSRLERIN